MNLSHFRSSTDLSESAFHTFWRDYALKLERECADLEFKMNLSQTKLLALSNLAVTTDTHRASDPTSKKKIATSTGKRDDRHVMVSNLNSLLSELVDENYPTGREPATFFVSLDYYSQLVSLGELPDFPVDVFFSATRRVIHAASDVLYSILETKSNLNRLEVLHDLMRFVIKTSFLRLSSSKSFGYLLFNELSGLLLSPVIHAFFPLSIKSLEHLLEPTGTNPSERQGTRQNGSDLHIDCRPKLVKLFQGIVSGIFSASYSLAKATSGDNFCQDASSMRDVLILETVRHLKEILSPISIENHNPGSARDEKNNPQEVNRVNSCSAELKKDLRVRRLAVKDAIWYLCSVLHILIGSSSSAANSNMSIDGRHEGSEILGEKISQEIFELVIDMHLRRHENSLLPFDASQTDSLGEATIARTDVKTTQELLVNFLEGRSHQNIEKPMQQILTSNKQADYFETTCEADTRPFGFSKHGTEGNHMHVLDEAEHGMLLCVVERYVNEK